MTTQLDLFASRLPIRPYCSNDLAYGVRVRPRDFALKQRYIQPNPPANVGYLVFDIDRQNAAFAWERPNLPVPSLVAVNPVNGHAHLFYAISTPVIKTDAARLSPLRFLAALQSAMTTMLDADRGYTMALAKNPCHPSWRVIDHSGAVYDLGELAEYVDLTLAKKTRCRAEISGLGRNCALFDTLRTKAYRKVGEFRDGGDVETWYAYILETARSMNAYAPPLPDSEVKATAKSVGKWVWRHFGNGVALGKFIERQRRRQKVAARVQRGAAAEKVVRAVQGLQRNGQRVTVAAIARLVGMHRTTITRLYRGLLDTFPMLDSGTTPSRDWERGDLPLGIPAPATRDERVVNLRNRGYTQTVIARKLGISQPAVSVILKSASEGEKEALNQGTNKSDASAKSDNSTFRQLAGLLS